MGTTSSRAAHMAPNLGRVVSTLPAWALYGVVTKSERMTEIAKHADHVSRPLSRIKPSLSKRAAQIVALSMSSRSVLPADNRRKLSQIIRLHI